MTDAPEDAKRQTTVSLLGFDAGYRTKSRKTAEAIAKAMLEHCLWHFVREGGCPRIVLEDDGEQIRLDEVFDQHMHSSAVGQQAILKDRRFDLLHVKLRTSAATRHAIAYCANNRLVLEERLEGRVPGLHGNLDDEEGEFAYVCYVSSTILDERVRPERSAFDLPTEVEGLFEDTDISWADIRGMVIGEAVKHLDSYLLGMKERARERVRTFVATQAPRYRPILGRLSPDALNIDPDISDKDLELTLHRHFADLERDLLHEGHDLLTPRHDETALAYKLRLAEYLQRSKTSRCPTLLATLPTGGWFLICLRWLSREGRTVTLAKTSFTR